jgi:GNAT superfamily N-acetyltransferase
MDQEGANAGIHQQRISQASIVTVAQRPDLVPVVSRWLWEEWGRHGGQSIEEEAARVATRTSASGPEQCFVLLTDGAPVATASLVHHDLSTRPDLTPWLAGVFVEPHFRGRGFASQLVKAVETACRLAGIPNIWLHTASAAGLYARLEWRAIGMEPLGETAVTLMCRCLLTR